MPIKSVLDKIRWTDYSNAFDGVASAFSRGRHQAQQEKELKLRQDQLRANQDAQAQAAQVAADKRAEAKRRWEIESARADAKESRAVESHAITMEGKIRQQQEMKAAKHDDFILQATEATMTQAPDSPQAQASLGARNEARERINLRDEQKWKQGYSAIETAAAVMMDADRPGQGLRSPRFAGEEADWADYLARAEEKFLTTKRAGAPNIVQNASPLTPANETKSQWKVVEGAEALGALNNIISAAKPEYFTRIGRGKGALLGEIAQWGGADTPDDWAEEVRARKYLFNEMDQFFLVYRKWATGVAGGEAEMKRIEESILNKNVSWPAFIAGVEQLHDKMGRSVRLHNHLLASGVPKGSPDEIMPMLLRASPGEQWNSEEHAQERDQQLRGIGVTDPKDRARIIKIEGYKF